jgi:hypothetical protein
MFCPVCKAEYREGFAQCHDCNVALVAELPHDESPEAYRVLWRGEDPVLRDRLCELLENDAIEYADTPLEVYLRKSGDPFNLSLGPRFGFVISVRVRQLQAATAILGKLLDEEPADIEIPLREEAATEAGTQPCRAMPDVEVWSGGEERIVQFLIAALGENEITKRVQTSGQGTAIYVSLSDEARAREIVKEVVEGVPPE